jgi:glutamate synthase (NADPH/NADH) small chain
VLGINQNPVTIKQVEVEIIDRAWDEGWVTPHVPAVRTGKRSPSSAPGPAGLAAAQQLTRAGHDVVVLERADRIGGLLRYGIPEFKMEKRHIDRRIEQMEAEGTEFRTNAVVGENVDIEVLRASHDASCWPAARPSWRDLPIPGVSSAASTRRWSTCRMPTGCSSATSRTADRRRGQARRDHRRWRHRRRLPRHRAPPGCGVGHAARDHAQAAGAAGPNNPWPQYAMTYKVTSAHEEGGERLYSVNTEEFLDDGAGRVRALRLHEVEMIDGAFVKVEGTDHEIPADFVFLAMGFVGPEKGSWLDGLDLEYDARGNVARDDRYMTNQHGCSSPATWVAGRA